MGISPAGGIKDVRGRDVSGGLQRLWEVLGRVSLAEHGDSLECGAIRKTRKRVRRYNNVNEQVQSMRREIMLSDCNAADPQ